MPFPIEGCEFELMSQERQAAIGAPFHLVSRCRTSAGDSGQASSQQHVLRS